MARKSEYLYHPAKTKTDAKQKENDSRTLISNKELDEIIDGKNAKSTEMYTPIRKKSSFLARLFSK